MGDLDCSHCRIPAQGRVATPRQFERHNLLSATGLATCHPACIPCSNSTRGLHVCRRHSIHDRSWILDQRQEGQVPACLLASLGNVWCSMPLSGNPLVRSAGLLSRTFKRNADKNSWTMTCMHNARLDMESTRQHSIAGHSIAGHSITGHSISIPPWITTPTNPWSTLEKRHTASWDFLLPCYKIGETPPGSLSRACAHDNLTGSHHSIMHFESRLCNVGDHA